MTALPPAKIAHPETGQTADPRVEALVNEVIGRVADKWTMLVLEVLAEHGELRFTRIGELAGGNYGFHFTTLSGLRVGLPFEDSDLDGHTDLQESLAGTGAADADSLLAMEAPAAGAAAVRFGSVAGKRYRIQYKLDHSADAPWADLPGSLTATGGLCVATGLVADAPAVFYRVRLDTP